MALKVISVGAVLFTLALGDAVSGLAGEAPSIGENYLCDGGLGFVVVGFM